MSMVSMKNPKKKKSDKSDDCCITAPYDDDPGGRRSLSFDGVALTEIDTAALDIASVTAVTANADHLIAVSEAVEKLSTEDASAAELVKLRFFAGLTNREAAEVMGITERNARRCWDFARPWLFHEIKRES